MSGIAVLLNPTWPGTFGRSVRGEDGSIVRRLVFEKNIPVVLEAEEYAAVFDDIGKALVHAATDESGKVLNRPDRSEQPAKKRKK